MNTNDDTTRFDCAGLDLARPVDSVKPARYPYLKNMRVYTPGQLEPRLGLVDEGIVVAGQTPLHSIRRLNDGAGSTYTYILGTGTHLAYGPFGGPYIDIDSGYSGDPLALVPFRPDQSTTAFMYAADRSRMRKLSTAGSLQPIGLAPPNAPPATALSDIPRYKVISDANATLAWTPALNAGAVSAIDRVDAAAVATFILFDTGSTGWACVVPSVGIDTIGPGTRLEFNGSEIVTVQEVHPAGTSDSIARIIYDSGTTGLASLVLTTPFYAQVQQDGLIRNISTSENARILSVTTGPDGVTSIRVSTVGTWGATNTVTVFASFRVFFVSNHAAGETIDGVALRSTFTYAAPGIGTLTLGGLTLDLSLFASGIPIRAEDYMHVSLRVDRPDRVTEGKLLLDVDVGTNDFSRNFYYKAFRAADITPAARNQQTSLATRTQIIQRNLIDQPIYDDSGNPTGEYAAPIEEIVYGVVDENGNVVSSTGASGQGDNSASVQMSPGDTQWVELLFRVSDLTRIGSDTSRTLKDVVSIRIQLTVTGDVVLDFDSWWIGGGYGPDMGDAGGYLYRHRARVKATGAASNFSPASRGALNAQRQSITVSPAQYAVPSGSTLATTDIVLDIERFGGNVPIWQYVGTTPNVASPAFIDNLLDDTVAGQPQLGNRSFQPWPIIQPPISGTTGSVAGTSVNDSAATFNLAWAPGTRIKVNGVAYTLYRVISTSRLALVENAGSQTGVAWEIEEPTLLGQPLPCLWGDEEFGAMFACGDNVNAGRLYFSNRLNPDATVESNYVDVTSPSEPLQNGVIWNGRSYVWSSERLFQILQTSSPQAPYRAEEIPGGRGMFNRWGLTRNPFAPFMGTLGKDGIYKSGGGAADSMTDGDLYPLFPNEGNVGEAVNGIPAPAILSTHPTKFRLEFYDGYLYFDYYTGEVYRTLAFNMATGGWFFDQYAPQIVCHYGGEGALVHELWGGGRDGHLYLYAGNSDAGTAIDCAVTSPSKDQGVARLNKFYGDSMLDLNPEGETVSVIPQVNNQATSFAAVTSLAAVRTQVTIPMGAEFRTARNINLAITFSVDSAIRPILYLWNHRWVPETAPLVALRWTNSPSHFQMPNFKHGGTVRICHVSPADLALVITADGVVLPTITVPASGNVYTETYFRVPVFKGKLLTFDLSSDEEWRLGTDDSWIELKEWGSDGPYTRVPVWQ